MDKDDKLTEAQVYNLFRTYEVFNRMAHIEKVNRRIDKLIHFFEETIFFLSIFMIILFIVWLVHLYY